MTGLRTLLLVAATVAGDPPAVPPRMVPTVPVPRTFPPFFVENRGQMPEDLRFVGHSRSVMVGLRTSGALLRPAGTWAALPMEYAGGTPAPPVPGTVLPTKVTLLLDGTRPVRAGGLLTYAGVAQPGVWPGVDVAWDISGRVPRMEIRLAPGADPGRVRFAFPAAATAAVSGDGGLVLRWPQTDILGNTTEGNLRFGAPDGATFALAGPGIATLRGPVGAPSTGSTLSCEVTGGEPGGSCWFEDVCGTGVAPDGTVVIAGRTTVFGFPGFGNPSREPSARGTRGSDVFVARIDPSGTVLRSMTFYGGGNPETPRSMAVGPDGTVAVVGNAGSLELPTTPGVFQPKALQYSGSFVVRFPASGGLPVFASWLGLGDGGSRTSGTDAWAVAVDGEGAVLVAGEVSTYENPFTWIPRGAGKGPPFPLERDPRRGTPTFAFLAKFRPDGKALDFCVPLGAEGIYGVPAAIALDPAGGAWVAGGFALAHVSPDGRSLSTHGLLSSPADTIPGTLSLDSTGSPLYVGMVRGAGFPLVRPAMGASDGHEWDLFVSRIKADGSGFRHSSYLGFGIGANELNGTGALDPADRAVVVGNTLNPQEWRDTPMAKRHRVLARWFFTIWSPAGDLERTVDIDLMGAEGHAAFVAVARGGTGYLGGSLRMVPDDPFAPFPHHLREEAYVLPLDVSGTGLFPEPPADVDPRFRMWPVSRRAGGPSAPAPEGDDGRGSGGGGAPVVSGKGADPEPGTAPGVGGAPSDPGIRKGLLVDRHMVGADLIRVEGRIDADALEESGGFDPDKDDLQILLGDRNAPFIFNIPAGDPAWKRHANGLLEWRSSVDSPAYGRVRLFPDRGTFDVRLYGFDFPAPQSNPIGVVFETRRRGFAGGEAIWKAKGEGVYRYPE